MVFLKKILKLWLVSILVFLPFQYLIAIISKPWSVTLSLFVSRLDEFTIIIALPFALREFYLNRKFYGKAYYISLISLFILLIITAINGLISGMINENSLPITFHGIFTYIKYFFVVFIYAEFFRESYELKKIFKFLLILTVSLVVISFIQEIWALSSRYIFQKSVFDKGVYILRKVSVGECGNSISSSNPCWRFGIYRTPSLLLHPNMFGIYILLIFTIYINFVRKINVAVFLPLITGILFSISRVAYAGCLLAVVIRISRYRRWFIILLIPVLIAVLWLSFLPNFNLMQLTDVPQFITSINIKGDNQASPGRISFRSYTRNKAVEIWKDHPYWGVGPGMFGGALSIKYNSYLYEKYNFEAIGHIRHVQGIDQFWPQILAEMGVIGITSYVGLYILLIMIFLILRKQTISDEIKGILGGLVVVTLIIFIYGFGSTLDAPFVLFTYFAIAGMGLGCSNKHGVKFRN